MPDIIIIIIQVQGPGWRMGLDWFLLFLCFFFPLLPYLLYTYHPSLPLSPFPSPSLPLPSPFPASPFPFPAPCLSLPACSSLPFPTTTTTCLTCNMKKTITYYYGSQRMDCDYILDNQPLAPAIVGLVWSVHIAGFTHPRPYLVPSPPVYIRHLVFRLTT